MKINPVYIEKKLKYPVYIACHVGVDDISTYITPKPN
jgi:hypothetical protein